MIKKITTHLLKKIILLESKTHKMFNFIGNIYDNRFDKKITPIKIIKPIFIIGSPRSGTTIFYKLFMRHPDLAYITQASDLFHDSPVFANKVIQRLISLTGESFLDKIDKGYLNQWKTHDFQYSEAPRLWWKFHPKSNNDYLNENDVTHKEKDFYQKFIKKHLFLFQKKRFVSKKPLNSLRILYLKNIFPDAIFIHILRDGMAVSSSLYERKKRFSKRFGATPAAMKNTQIELKITHCGLQWKGIVETILDDFKKLNINQAITIKYENFIKDWKKSVYQVFKFCGLDTHKEIDFSGIEVSKENNRKWRKMLTDQEIKELKKEIGLFRKKIGYL